jgi:hypothetical protein
VFGVPSGRFLGFQVHQRGIEVNPEKIRALEGMASPKTLKDVQRLTGCLASLNRFIAKSTDKCAPFFRAIKKGKGLEWSTECEEAFQKLKEYLGRAPILSKPVVGETLYLYLSVTEGGDKFGINPVRGRDTKTSVLHKQGIVTSRNQVFAGRKNSASTNHIGQEIEAIFPSAYNRGVH